MGRLCSVCSHDKLDEIDKALAAGEAARQVAGRYDLSARAVQRHAANHLAPTLNEFLRQEADRTEALVNDLWRRVEVLLIAATNILADAMAANDANRALRAMAQLRPNIELAAKLVGLLQQNSGTTVNVATAVQVEQGGLSAEEWDRATAVLLEALGPYPEARAAAARALLEVGDTVTPTGG
jgi:hypothetical protein